MALTVVLRDQTFHLSEQQVAFDGPNYFTRTLERMSDLPVQQRKTFLDRNPQLFSVILEYLTGYVILPLGSSAAPPSMTPEVALQNLLEDAKFYQLKGLERRISEWRNRSSFEYVVS